MPAAWTATLLRLAALLVAGGLLGWFYDALVPGVLIASLGALAWHLYHLYQRDRWLQTGRLDSIPEGAGTWPRVFARIEYIREKSRKRRRRWRALVREIRASARSFPDGGVLLNDRHEILAYNTAAQRLLNLKRTRDRGQRIENLLRHPDFVAHLASGSYGKSIELPAPAGHDTWISCLLIPYGPQQRLLLIRDITANVRLERTRRDFVANASHELRTPLTVISGYLEALQEDEAAPEVWRQPLIEMDNQAKRMSQLLDDLLELSRLESAQPCSLETEVDIVALVHTARKEALAMSQHPQVVDVDIRSSTRLLGDEKEIHSVVSNLVSNAVRYTPSDGAIRIEWDVDDRGGRLTVSDTGIGIAEEEIPRITERFFRTDSGRARQKGGTGLGLAIVKYALRRHEADLEIRSRLGEGSSFTCHFPPHRLALS
ncbi:MAG: phosphate regulon sensor histidine kinase PhoR [Gammaproteobacteria bacterium]|nr:phosphate regulon sensor histidine kinase PhoR [Gammaproteobacteria bacterium]